MIQAIKIKKNFVDSNKEIDKKCEFMSRTLNILKFFRWPNHPKKIML